MQTGLGNNYFEGERTHGSCSRNRPRNHQLCGGRTRGWRTHRHRQRRRIPHDPVGCRLHEGRRGAGRRDRQAPGRHQRRPHHCLGQAPHGHRLVRRRRRQEVHPAGGFGPHPGQAQARRRGLPGRHRDGCRHHRSRLLQRRRAPGHQGGRRDLRAQRAPHHQRADRRRARLRPRQGQGRRAHPGLRPRRRNLRRLAPRGGQGRRVLHHPGAFDRRRQPPRRRRLGPAHRRPPDQEVQGNHRRRRLQGQDRQAAPQGSRGAGQEGTLQQHVDEHPAALPLADRERPGQPRRDAHPRPVREDDRRPARPHQEAVPGRHP